MSESPRSTRATLTAHYRHGTLENALLAARTAAGKDIDHLAQAYGSRVKGIDLSDEYVAVDTDLTRRMRLADRVTPSI